MKLYIHDKCMEQLFELPKVIQKRVLEFQKKFRENSRSEAINLEPIITFKDPFLRTARIDLKYRAIVKVPETGDNYYLLWVDNHDEAMDWAKNKIFQWNENTQTAQIFTSPEEQVLHTAQIQDTNDNLFGVYPDEKLLSIGIPSQTLELVKSIKDLNGLGECEKYLPVDAFENLFYLSEGVNIELLIAEINEGKSKSNNIDEQIESLNNKRSFVEVDDELMADFINGELSKWQVFLHPSQRKLVESNFKGSVKVTGGAGTGKTVVALHRLKFLSSFLSTNEKRKIVFTTFTNALTVNLKMLVGKLSVDPNKVIIINIDSLVRDLAKEYHLINDKTRILDFLNSKNSIDLWNELLEQQLSEFEPEFLASEYRQVILYNNVLSLEHYFKTPRTGRGKPISGKQKKEVWELVNLYNQKKRAENFVDREELFNVVSKHLQGLAIKPYVNLIADEVQDLSNVELRFIRSLVDEKENDIFLVGDPYQKIYSRKINFTAAKISVRGNRSKQLRINYRTSEEIKRLAISAVKGIKYDDFDGEAEKLNGYLSLFHGEQPTYTVYKTKNEEIDAILNTINELKQSGYSYGDIAIGARKKDSIKDIKTTLHKLKIPYHDNTSGGSSISNEITLSTFHGLKGLEFKAVLLVDVNNSTSPLLFSRYESLEKSEKEDYLNSERSLIYVAITRAISVLKIFGTGTKSSIIEI